MNHLKRKLEKLTNEQLKHVCNKMGVKHIKSKKLTIINLLKPFVKKYKYLEPPGTRNTLTKIGKNYGLWRASPGLRDFPKMNERVNGLLFGANSFDETDLEPINYIIGNLRNDQDKQIFELNRNIIRYKVNNPSADENAIITYIQQREDRSRIGPDDDGDEEKIDG